MTRDQIPTLSGKEGIVLELLRPQEMYGLQLVAESKGRLKRGTVYVTLGRMEEKGYVASRTEDPAPSAGGLPRRLYQMTGHGRRVLDAWTMLRQKLALEVGR